VDRERSREGPRCGSHVQRGDPQAPGRQELRHRGDSEPLGTDPPPESDDVVRLIVRVIPEKVTNFSA